MDAEKALEGRCEAIFVLLCCISAEACDAFGRAVGRVVGGAERHGRGPCLQRRPLSGKCCPSQIRRQVLVKVTDRSEATICQIPKGRRASGPSTRCFLVQAEGRHISECVTRPALPPIVGDEVRRNPNGLRPSPLASAPTAARGIAFTAAAADAEAPRFRTVAVPNSPGTCRLSSKRRGNLEVPSFLGFRGLHRSGQVLPRKSTLVRRRHCKSQSLCGAASPRFVWRRAGAPHQEQLLCANLDLAVLVLSTEPNFSEASLSR